MKRSACLLIFIVTLICSVCLLIDVMIVCTPELFGNGTMYIFRIRDRFAGYIDAWGGWIIYGSVTDCRIVQITGEQISDAEQPVPCHMNFNGNKFRGWIDFRGHPRAFCGASSMEQLPQKCYGQ